MGRAESEAEESLLDVRVSGDEGVDKGRRGVSSRVGSQCQGWVRTVAVARTKGDVASMQAAGLFYLLSTPAVVLHSAHVLMEKGGGGGRSGAGLCWRRQFRYSPNRAQWKYRVCFGSCEVQKTPF